MSNNIVIVCIRNKTVFFDKQFSEKKIVNIFIESLK